jgi:GTP-binding protein Era
VSEVFHSGYVSLVGRPNVGKSTLLNAVLGQKIAIVTRRPQTTRNRILGIKTSSDAQIIFIDTPGIHEPRNLLGRAMVRSAREVLKEIDLVVFVTEPGPHVEKDRIVFQALEGTGKPTFLLINKIDLVQRQEILRVIGIYKDLFPFTEVIPVSALKRDGLDIFLRKVREYLPEGPKYYPEDLVTDQIERFMAAEIVREKIMAKTSDEIPYSVAVEVRNWAEREDGMVMIDANIYVEREGQKGIIIGDKGKKLKAIGTQARLDIEKLLDAKVFLQLWVKVRKGWRDDHKALNEMGF